MLTIELAKDKIWLWDLKLTVRFSSLLGICLLMAFLIYLVLNMLLISENLKLTPLEIACALSPQ